MTATNITETSEKKALTKENLEQALMGVIDPELNMNIVELGLVYNILIKEPAAAEQKPDIEVEMTLTSPACPYGPVIMGQVPVVIKNEFKDQIHEVDVNLTFTPPWDPVTMASEDVKMDLGIW